MNTQRVIVLIAALIAAGMAIYPPWCCYIYATYGAEKVTGNYGSIFKPIDEHVDLERLFVQELALLFLAGGALYLTKKRVSI